MPLLDEGKIAYYPDELLGHAFLASLSESNEDLFNRAKNYFDTLRQNLKGDANRPANLNSLKQLAEYERDKEQKLLASVMPELIQTDSRKVGNYIHAFNILLGQDAIFQRNVKRVKAIHNGRGGSIDITSNFGSFLRAQLDSMQPNDFTEEGLYRATQQALIEMFRKNYDRDKTEQSAYIDLATALENAQSVDWVVKEVFDLYFGPDLTREFQDAVEHDRNTIISSTTQDLIKKSVNFQMYRGTKKGNLLEAVERLIQQVTGQFETLATGATGMKADNLLTMGISIDQINEAITQQVQKQASKRLQNIERLEHLHEALAKIKGQIVEVTDKNYSLTSETFAENKGFTAESGLQAAFFERILNRMQIPSRDINELMFVLANTHFLMLSEDEDFSNAERVLGAYVGFFLFDDLQIPDVEEGVNFVHLMNLNGIYIPLSTFLFAAYNAFMQSSKPEEADKYVKVHIEQTFAGWKNDDETLTPADWNNFYNQRLKEIRITTHFFGDFVNFIKTYIEL